MKFIFFQIEKTDLLENEKETCMYSPHKIDLVFQFKKNVIWRTNKPYSFLKKGF